MAHSSSDPSSPSASGVSPATDSDGGEADGAVRCYLVSSTFDYEKTICSDYGPAYASHMGWPPIGLDDAQEAVRNYPVVLVDTRFDESECERLRQLVRTHRGTMFGFSVIDPFEWVVERPYPSMLFDIKDEPNVFFLSRYQPKEIVRELDAGDNSVVIPYAFVDPVCSMEDFGKREWKVLHSGRHNVSKYPYRQTLYRLHKWLPPYRSCIDILGHPGYPDAGEPQKHDIVGDAYVRFLSRYAFMFASPSRLHLEFLKFRECAMAGCMPVGVPPDGFHDDMRQPFPDIAFDNVARAAAELPRLFWMSRAEVEERAQAYRTAYRMHRNPALLNEKLSTFLDETGRV